MNAYSRILGRSTWLAGLLALCMSASGFAQHKASALRRACLSATAMFPEIRSMSPANKGRMHMAKSPVLTSPCRPQMLSPLSEKVVKEAGFQMTDIVSVTVYVTDLNDVEKMNEVYKKLMPDPKPARATVQVAGLIGGAKIEISAIAVKH